MTDPIRATPGQDPIDGAPRIMSLEPGEAESAAGLGQAADPFATLRPVRVVLDSHGHVGAALRGARESLGMAADDIAQATRVRGDYIVAIECFDFAALPARPFVVGYVRAYARSLGLDAETVVARFHAEAPKVDGRLREPMGVRHETPASFRWLLLAGGLLAVAVIGWNVARRATLQPAVTVGAHSPAIAAPRREMGPAQIGAPLPTPPEATTPPVYQTPGLETRTVGPAPVPTTGLTDGLPGAPAAAFIAAGPVFGAPMVRDSGPGIILQARKATTLVVRDAAGAVSFARLLAPGEAWRAPPDAAGLTADIGAPLSVEVFVGGTSRGRLAHASTTLSRLVSP